MWGGYVWWSGELVESGGEGVDGFGDIFNPLHAWNFASTGGCIRELIFGIHSFRSEVASYHVVEQRGCMELHLLTLPSDMMKPIMWLLGMTSQLVFATVLHLTAFNVYIQRRHSNDQSDPQKPSSLSIRSSPPRSFQPELSGSSYSTSRSKLSSQQPRSTTQTR